MSSKAVNTVVGIHKNWLLGACDNIEALKALTPKKFLFVSAEVWTTGEVDATATTLTKYLSEWQNTS